MQLPQIRFPTSVVWMIEKLEAGGYEAFAVGGCVRDSLLKRPVHDWDLCTSATPLQIVSLFVSYRLVETGAQYGTVTLILEQVPYEITTFRLDGSYSDGRRPDRVSFSTSLADDLKRRDFTINAMACHPQKGLIDLHGGLSDLRAGLLRCVGVPDERFAEDALRILRALRFASVCGFEIERETGFSIQQQAERLACVPPERITAELCKLLKGGGAGDMLRMFPIVFEQIIPSLCPTEELACVLDNSGGELGICLYELAYSAVKLCANTVDLKTIFERLRLDRHMVKQIEMLISQKDTPLDGERAATKRLMGTIMPEGVRLLIRARRARTLVWPDTLARATTLVQLEKADAIVLEVLREKQCYCRAQLEVNGKDLIECGVPTGKVLGDTLEYLLEMVIIEKVENKRKSLIALIIALKGPIW